MFPTVEIRWFYRGEIPGEIQSWFDQIVDQRTQPIIQTPRTDTYLLEQGNTSLGIKLREGRLEIKQRVREYGQIEFSQDVNGIVEGWRKWSFLIAPEQTNLLSPKILSDTWIDVKKERKLYNFIITHQAVKSSPMPDYSSGGCNFELTQIHFWGDTWWSIGLEASGEENSNYDRLKIATKNILSLPPPQSMKAHDSRGYPKWLESVNRESND